MKVAIVMGSDSDLDVMSAAVSTLSAFGIPHEVHCVSAHRDPEGMIAFGKSAVEDGFGVIIAAAGGAAHLPGMLASVTELPVIGVPVGREATAGMDALLSIAQMPAGIPVATMAIDGAENAALLAIRILALSDEAIAVKIRQHQKDLRAVVAKKDAKIQQLVAKNSNSKKKK